MCGFDEENIDLPHPQRRDIHCWAKLSSLPFPSARNTCKAMQEFPWDILKIIGGGASFYADFQTLTLTILMY